jgi:iron(II)-dependent oxidoreductase
MRVPHKAGRKYYDLWHGVELTPEVRGETATLSFGIEGDGYGALLASDVASPPADLQKFLGEMSPLGRTRLNSFTRERRFLPQRAAGVTISRKVPCGTSRRRIG